MKVRAGIDAQPTSLNLIAADQAAFRDWYEQALPRVYRYVYARCGGDQALAEELTQQTFIQAIRGRAGFEGRSDPITWLCAIARNQLVDHHRRSRRETARDLRVAADWSDRETEVWAEQELRSRIKSALAELPGEQRIVLILRYLDRMPVREIASVVRRSDKATESLLSRAREAFKRAYEAQTNE